MGDSKFLWSDRWLAIMVCSQSLPISQPRLQSGSRQIGHSAPSGPHSIPSLIMIWQCVKTNSTLVVHIKIAGKWMFIPLKMVLIGIDPYPFWWFIVNFPHHSRRFLGWKSMEIPWEIRLLGRPTHRDRPKSPADGLEIVGGCFRLPSGNLT